MFEFPYTKTAKVSFAFAIVLASIGITLPTTSEAESKIDKYRNKNKPMVRRYQEKLNMGKEAPASLKAEKRALPPGTFKQKGIFGTEIDAEIPGADIAPMDESPYVPEDTEPQRQMIDASRFRDPNLDTKSVYESEEEAPDPNEPKEIILDYDNLAAEIMAQQLGDNSFLQDGILPTEDQLSKTLTQDLNQDDLLEQEDRPDDLLNRMLLEDKLTTPFQPAATLSPDSLQPQNSSNPMSPENAMRSEQENTFAPVVSDQRLVTGELPIEGLSDDSTNDNNPEFAQSQDLIDKLVTPHVTSFKQSVSERAPSATEKLLAKYSISPPDLSYEKGNSSETADVDTANFGSSNINDMNNALNSLNDNPAVTQNSGLQSGIDLNAQPFGNSAFASPSDLGGAQPSSLFSGFSSGDANGDLNSTQDPAMFGNTDTIKNPQGVSIFGGPVQPDRESMPALRIGATTSRYEINTRDRSGNNADTARNSNRQSGLGSTDTQTRSSALPGLDLMNRQNSRVRSSFDNRDSRFGTGR